MEGLLGVGEVVGVSLSKLGYEDIDLRVEACAKHVADVTDRFVRGKQPERGDDVSRRAQRSDGFVKGRDVVGRFETVHDDQNHGVPPG